jgi:hypothetical protein
MPCLGAVVIPVLSLWFAAWGGQELPNTLGSFGW